MSHSLYDKAKMWMGAEGVSQFAPLLRRSVPFHFGTREESNGITESVEPKTEEETNDIWESFFLPFPIVFLEDGVSGVLIARVDAAMKAISNDQNGPRDDSQSPLGLRGCPFVFFEFFALHPRIENGNYLAIGKSIPKCYGDATARAHVLDPLIARGRRMDSDAIFVRMTTFIPTNPIHPGWRVEAACVAYSSFLIDERGAFGYTFPKESNSEEFRQLAADCLQSFQAAVMQVVAINSPLNIVVERKEDVHLMIQKRNGKRSPVVRKSTRFLVLPRASAYRLVTGDISDSAESAKRAAHARRRHWRTLRSERFRPEKRGTRVCVRECWIGPREREDGGVKYVVRLDLGAPLPAGESESDVGAEQKP